MVQQFLRYFPNMVQEALVRSNLDKVIRSYCFYCTDTVESLTRPKRSKNLFSYGTFFKGRIHQVSRETYGIYVIYLKNLKNDGAKDVRRKLDILCQTDNNIDGLMNTTKGGSLSSPVPFFQKGQLIILEKEIQKVFYIENTGEF